MTKIPSIEQEILKWMNAYIPEGKTVPVFEDMLEQYATTERTALLTELRETSRERQKGWLGKEENGSDRHPNYDEHDWLQAHLDELINSTK